MKFEIRLLDYFISIIMNIEKKLFKEKSFLSYKLFIQNFVKKHNNSYANFFSFQYENLSLNNKYKHKYKNYNICIPARKKIIRIQCNGIFNMIKIKRKRKAAYKKWNEHIYIKWNEHVYNL